MNARISMKLVVDPGVSGHGLRSPPEVFESSNSAAPTSYWPAKLKYSLATMSFVMLSMLSVAKAPEW
jgi:hypothetical protein